MFTILHLENSGFFRKIFNEIFISKGYNYISAKDSRSAKDLLYRYDVDVILTALELKGGSGENFIKDLSNSSYKDIPIFVITSNDRIEERKNLFGFGIIDYILKTTSINDIVKVIDNFMNEDDIINRLKGLEIAVLDDSELELNVVKSMFADRNISNVDYYKNGKELMKIDKLYDIYLIDMVLRDCSGEEVILNIREFSDISVVFAVSGITNSKTISHVLSIGADDYITKPYSQEIFFAKLKSKVRSYFLLKELKQKLEKFEKREKKSVNRRKIQGV